MSSLHNEVHTHFFAEGISDFTISCLHPLLERWYRDEVRVAGCDHRLCHLLDESRMVVDGPHDGPQLQPGEKAQKMVEQKIKQKERGKEINTFVCKYHGSPSPMQSNLLGASTSPMSTSTHQPKKKKI